MPSRIRCLSLLLAICLINTLSTHAALLISEIEFGDPAPTAENPDIAKSLTFKLVGTIDKVGAEDQNLLAIGQLGNTDWILGYSGGTWKPDEAMSLPTAVTVGVEAISGTPSDRVVVYLGGGVQGSATFVHEQFISGTVLIEGGEFDPSKTDTAEWVVAAGTNNSVFFDPETITGNATPEPTSMVILSLGALLILSRRRCHPVAAS